MQRITTTRLRLHLILMLACLLLAGCAGADRALVDAADHFANVTVGPEYEAYVNDDPDLGEIDKAVRLENVRTFRAAVQAAKQ